MNKKREHDLAVQTQLHELPGLSRGLAGVTVVNLGGRKSDVCRTAFPGRPFVRIPLREKSGECGSGIGHNSAWASDGRFFDDSVARGVTRGESRHLRAEFLQIPLPGVTLP